MGQTNPSRASWWKTFRFHKENCEDHICVGVSEWFQHKWDETEEEQQWAGTGAFPTLESGRIIILLQRPKALVGTQQRKAVLSSCQWFLSSGTTAACAGAWHVFSGFINPLMSLLPCNKCSCCLQTAPGTTSSITMKITPLTERAFLAKALPRRNQKSL